MRFFRCMDKLTLAQLWFLGLITAFFAATARLGNELFRQDTIPPEDPIQAKHWSRRRIFWVVSELMALPFFPTFAVAVTLYFKLDLLVALLICAFLGLLGVGFILHATKFLVNKKLELPQ